MLKQVISAKMLSIFALTAVMLSATLVWCLRPTTALALESSTGTGLITVNSGQTARLIVTTPILSTDWGNDRPETLVLGFDVFKPGQTLAAAAVQKHFLLERRVNEVTLTPGEAASVDFVSESGLLHVRPLVFGNGTVRKFDVTIELINGDGTVATATLLPAIQKLGVPQ